MTTGEYVLELTCDQKEGCAESGYFAYATRFLARQMAREAGWLLSQKGNRCFCPDHAAERRKAWRTSPVWNLKANASDKAGYGNIQDKGFYP